jgi:hypothetical protein
MEYPHSVTGNEDRRSEDSARSPQGPGTQPRPMSRLEPEVLAERVRPTSSRRGPDPTLVVALALCVAIGALVVKPWSWVGGLVPGAGVPTPAAAGQPGGPAATSSPTGEASPDLVGGGPNGQPTGATPTASPPIWAFIENLDPIDPTTWSGLSATLRPVNRDGVVFVARVPKAGLYWGFVPIDPNDSLTMTFDGGNAVRKTGYLGAPIAIGITRPTGAPEPITLGWQVLGPGAELRLPLRNPVGDLDRYLWLGPGLGLPRGEQRNRREISRFPPVWLPGLYRFDLTTPTGETRHLFVVLDPDAST